MTVLEDLVASARMRAATLVPGVPSGDLPPDFAAALAGRDRVAVIAEFKRCSPSRGVINTSVDLRTQVRRYAAGGAAALSVLTEPSRFGGADEDLQAAVAATGLPVLLKDFVVLPCQVEQAASLGAAAVLLIVRCLQESQLRELASAVFELGMTPLVECHGVNELERAVAIQGAVIGVNHRNLATLEIERSTDLLRRLPPDRVVVSESGVERPGEVQELRGIADAVLIGTTLMQSADPEAFLREALR